MKVQVCRNPLLKSVTILVVNSILGEGHHGSQGTKTQQIGCHLSNFDGSTLTCRDHGSKTCQKHTTKTTPPNWSNKTSVFYCTISCLNLSIQHDSSGSSQKLLAHLNGKRQNKWALIPELPLTSTIAIRHLSSPRNVGFQEGSFGHVAWGFTELSCFG